MNTNAAWIAVDWGTSFVRVWYLNAQGQILDKRHSDQGAGRIQAPQYEAVLLSLVQDWLKADEVTPVLICGMAGSRQGWQEAPYLAIPLALHADLKPIRVPTQDQRLKVAILPGLKQLQPADVMRGEETQLVGFLSHYPDFNGVVALPGTHNKWVQLQQGTVQHFSTCMTGELFQLLAEQSLLRHSVNSTEWDEAAFEAAVLTAFQSPASGVSRLFNLRARDLLLATPHAELRARLSGELMGLELSAIQSSTLLRKDTPVMLIGTNQLAQLYKTALRLVGIDALLCSGELLSVTGLTALYQEGLACSTVS